MERGAWVAWGVKFLECKLGHSECGGQRTGFYVQQVQCRVYRPHKYAENSVRYSLIVNSPRPI